MLSVGQLLSQERIKKGLTLKQVEKEIRIRESFLQAVEENKWESFSSKIYITGVIKNYAKFLGLDPQKMIIFFRRDYEKNEELRFKKRVSTTYLHPETKKILYVTVVSIFLLFFLYFGYQLKTFFSPPVVQILSPTQQRFKGDTSVHITGKTEKDATIVIGTEKVYPNKDGVFEFDLPLQAKQTVLQIEVTGANGKKTILKKMFIRD